MAGRVLDAVESRSDQQPGKGLRLPVGRADRNLGNRTETPEKSPVSEVREPELAINAYLSEHPFGDQVLGDRVRTAENLDERGQARGGQVTGSIIAARRRWRVEPVRPASEKCSGPRSAR